MKRKCYSAVLALALSCASFAGLAVAAGKSEPAKPVAVATTAAPVTASAEQGATVNINAVDADTLQKELQGIGKVKAEAIVKYREANGPFTSVDQLLEVKGIGKATLDKNRDKLRI